MAICPKHTTNGRDGTQDTDGGTSIRVSAFGVHADGTWAASVSNTFVTGGLELSPRLDLYADLLFRRCGDRLEAVQMKSRLRVLRAEREWSQAHLAERLGVSRQTVNAI